MIRQLSLTTAQTAEELGRRWITTDKIGEYLLGGGLCFGDKASFNEDFTRQLGAFALMVYVLSVYPTIWWDKERTIATYSALNTMMFQKLGAVDYTDLSILLALVNDMSILGWVTLAICSGVIILLGSPK